MQSGYAKLDLHAGDAKYCVSTESAKKEARCESAGLPFLQYFLLLKQHFYNNMLNLL
jgi:hypothetical protein